MKKKINVLHLASFDGNIGDCANHSGLMSLIDKCWDYEVIKTNLEIREFYWKNLTFDEDFVEIANKYDLVIIGGGNYFELWLDNSRTGTSLDISIGALKRIVPPILFNALGVDIGMGYSQKSKSSFKRFIDFLISSPKYYLSIRNDGSSDAIREVLGSRYLEYFTSTPDGGFFASVNKDAIISGIDFNKDRVIGINVANDMNSIRFEGSRSKTNKLSEECFSAELAEVIDIYLIKYLNAKVIFFPHIYKDLEIISSIISKINDKVRRTKITVAPYSNGEEASKYIFGLYSKCKIVMGMRFHANVCPIGQSVPTIALSNYRQIKCLYKELNLEERCVDISKSGFSNIVMDKIENIFSESTYKQEEVDRTLNFLNNDAYQAHYSINKWLNSQLSFGINDGFLSTKEEDLSH